MVPFEKFNLASFGDIVNLNLRYRACFELRVFLDIQATIECKFTLKRVRDMIVTCTVQISTHNAAQLFVQFG